MAWHSLDVTTDGSGDATETGWDTDFEGILVGVRLEISGLAATADITISEPAGLQRSILAITDTNTNATYNPQDEVDNSAGVGQSTYTPFLVSSHNLQVVIAQGGDTNSATVYVLVME